VLSDTRHVHSTGSKGAANEEVQAGVARSVLPSCPAIGAVKWITGADHFSREEEKKGAEQ